MNFDHLSDFSYSFSMVLGGTVSCIATDDSGLQALAVAGDGPDGGQLLVYLHAQENIANQWNKNKFPSNELCMFQSNKPVHIHELYNFVFCSVANV